MDANPSSETLFTARAAWDYGSDLASELRFSAGDVIKVSEVVSDTWWRGRLGDAAPGSAALLFPAIYVEREPDEPPHVEGAENTSAAVSETTVPALAPGDVGATTSRSQRYRQTLSLHSSERIVHIEIIDAERKITNSELHSWYAVHLQTSRRTVQCEKRFHDIVQAEQQLQVLFAANMAGAPTLSLGARPELYAKKRTARTMEARRVAAEALLQFAVRDHAMGTLLLTFFLGSDSGVVAIPTIIAEPDAACDAASSAEVPPAVLDEAAWPAAVAASATPFSLDDMDAFDALLNTGVAVIPGDLVGAPLGSSFGSEAQDPALLGAPPRDGQRVRLSLASFIWDGSSSAVRCHILAPRCELTLGDCRDERLPLGLHAALRALPCPMAGPATAIVAPRLAYGDAGCPPAVPAGANLVLVLCVRSVEGVPRPMAAFSRAPPAPGLAMGSAVADASDDSRLRLVLESPGAAASPLPPVASTASASGRAGGAAAAFLPTLGDGSAVVPLAAAALGSSSGGGVALPPGTIISSSGHLMPSPDAAEKALRAYLASIGQDAPLPPPPPPSGGARSARKSAAAGGSSGGGILQMLFGSGGGGASPNPQVPSTAPAGAGAPASTAPVETGAAAAGGGEGGGSIFKYLFSSGGGGTARRKSSVASDAAADGGASGAATDAGSIPGGARPQRGGGGAGHARSVTEGGIRAAGGGGGGGKPSSLASAAAVSRQQQHPHVKPPAVPGGAGAHEVVVSATVTVEPAALGGSGRPPLGSTKTAGTQD